MAQPDPPSGLNDIPLIVLTAGKGYADEPERFPPAITLATLEAADEVWMEMQAELAALSTNSEHIVVEDAAHNIQFDDPDAVIEAILEVVAMASN